MKQGRMQPKTLLFPASASSAGFEFDVFLSFRGETRKTFTDHLHKALDDRGIKVFIDEDGLEKGEEIMKLIEKIERCEIFIPIFSKNYANSRWCLREITKIVECGRLILPIFYHVDPSDVRSQTGPFQESFQMHKDDATNNRKGISNETVQEWREALKTAASQVGFHVTCDGYEARIIQKVVDKVLSKLNVCPLDVAKHPIGIRARLKHLMKKLEIGETDARIVGIWGMGGMGKTTLAKAVYNKISHHFEGNSFISDVQETAKAKDIVALQNQLLSDILKSKNFNVSHESNGINVIKKRIVNKKVLIILDNVNDKHQIDSLAGDTSWFKPGSRIIITTRNKDLLIGLEEHHIYEPKGLDPQQSLKLFSWHAFRRETPDHIFMELANKMVDATGGVPLAIEVIGSSLFRVNSVTVWKETLEKLYSLPHPGIHEKLKLSYDLLSADEKSIFLDIACIMHGLEREVAVPIWDACGFSSEKSIMNLLNRSLITVEDGSILMHDLLQEMGRQIVEESTKSDSSAKSRLWTRNEILDVLEEDHIATSKIEGIKLVRNKNGNERRVSKDEDRATRTEGFAFMRNLRLLEIGDKALDGEWYKYLPKRLSWLLWEGCPLEALPKDLELQNIAALSLVRSKITRVCIDTSVREKAFKKLRVLALSGSRELTTVDFSVFPNLEILYLHGCKLLVEVSENIGLLKRLVVLNLEKCIKLKKLPHTISHLTSLTKLVLSGCHALERLPNCIHQLTSFEHLYLDYCEGLKRLPKNLFESANLKYLNLRRCVKLKMLPDSASQCPSLEELTLQDCFSITKLPDHICKSSSLRRLWMGLYHLREFEQEQPLLTMQNLELLELRVYPMKVLSDSLQNLKSIRFLYQHQAITLSELPTWIGSLQLLEELVLSHSNVGRLPESIGSLKNLMVLAASWCDKLTELPDSIGGLESLLELDLRGTSLRLLPDSLRCLTNLEKLKLRSCRLLGRLPDGICGMVNLSQLILDDTSIKELPSTISLSSFENLELLSLRGCSIATPMVDLICEDVHILQGPMDEGDRQQSYILKLYKRLVEGYHNHNEREKLLFLSLDYCVPLQSSRDSLGNTGGCESFARGFSSLVGPDCVPPSILEDVNQEIERMVAEFTRLIRPRAEACLPSEVVEKIPIDLNDDHFFRHLYRHYKPKLLDKLVWILTDEGRILRELFVNLYPRYHH